MAQKVQLFSNDGRVIIPAELNAMDGLKSGDQVIFRTNEYGQIVVEKISD